MEVSVICGFSNFIALGFSSSFCTSTYLIQSHHATYETSLGPGQFAHPHLMAAQPPQRPGRISKEQACGKKSNKSHRRYSGTIESKI